MTDPNSRGPIRRFVTRVLAAGALIGIYAINTVAVSGLVLTTTVAPAFAQRGRGGYVRGGYRGRGWRGGRGYHRGNVGAAVGAGVALGIIGGAIMADQARRNAAASCAARYRSYDPGSGTYLGYDGFRHPCP